MLNRVVVTVVGASEEVDEMNNNFLEGPGRCKYVVISIDKGGRYKEIT